MTDIISWSPVDASNNAAPPAGWPENMQPSAVNDCARAMMGAIRRYYDTLQSGSFVLPYLSTAGGTVTGNIAVSGRITATQVDTAALNVTAGPAVFAGAVTTLGNTTLATLRVTGTSVLEGLVATNALDVNGAFAVNGSSSLSGNLTVTGATTLNYLHAGSVDVDTALWVKGGNLTVTGATTLNYLRAGFVDVDTGLRVNSGDLTCAGSLIVSANVGISGYLAVNGTSYLNGTGNAAVSVPFGGITVAGPSSFPYIYGGAAAAGTLQTYGTGNKVCFRWDGANLFLRMDELLEQRIPYANNFNGFDLGAGGGASPTGYDLAAYSSGTPFILHIDIVSDRRLKENVRDSEVDALGAILATPVRAFDWSEAGRRYMPYIDPHAPIGLVAQEVQETMPWVVGVSNFKEADDVPLRDMHRVLHDRLTAYLVRAVQQLSARIDSLTTGENHV